MRLISRLMFAVLTTSATLSLAGCGDSKSATPTTTADATSDAAVTDIGTDGSATDAAADTAGTDATFDVTQSDVTQNDAGADAGTDTATDVQPADSTSIDAADTAQDTAPDVQADTTLSGNACQDLGGVCLGLGGNCEGGKGESLPAGDAGCIFDDGPGSCCKPPAMTDKSTTCADFGGVCAPIAGCNFTKGSFAPFSCGGVGVVCCVPPTVCGPETEACCNDMTTYRPQCDHGKFTCAGLDGTTLKDKSLCPQ